MIPFHQIGRSKLSGLHVAAAAAAHKLVVISVQDNNSRCFFFSKSRRLHASAAPSIGCLCDLRLD
jgi:hypothetical protein